MPQTIDFLTLYVNKLGICEYADSNTMLFEGLTTRKSIEDIHVDQLFKESKFYAPIVTWLQSDTNEFWEDIIEDVFKSFVVSIQPIKINTIVAAVTIRTSIITRKLDQLKYQYESALENANVGLWVWIDVDKDQSWWSDSFYKLLGYEIDEINPGVEAFSKLIHPEHIEDFTNTIKSFYERQTNYQNSNQTNLEIKMRTKGGSYKYLLFTAKFTKMNNAIRFSGTVVDIDLLKNTEIELQQRDEQLQLSMEAANMGAWTWEIDTNEVIWSDHLFEIFEIEKNQFGGNFESYLKIVSKEERSLVKEVIENAMLQGDTHFSFKHTSARPNKALKTLFSKGKIFYKKEKPYRMTGIVLDITKENSLKKLLELTQERYKIVFESMTEGVLIIDMNETIVDHNIAAAKIVGYEDDVLIGEELTYGDGIAVREDFSNFPTEEFPGIKTIRTGKGFRNVPLGWIKTSKELVWLSINSEPILDQQGIQIGAVCTYIDITERYTAISKLKMKNRQLEDFAHITSHNLRSPISNLSILLDYYETSTSEGDRKEYFENLKHVSTTLLSTIQVLAESLKIQKDFIDDECEISFQEVLNNVLKLLSGQIKEANASFDIDFEGCKSITYSKTYLESIFINLISNAIKYRSKSRQPIIQVRTSYSEQQQPTLTVTDNGVGIDLSKNKEKIFGLYKTFHANKDSRGVGLYMTKRQIETLGGTISVSSQIDVGTTFTVQFK